MSLQIQGIITNKVDPETKQSKNTGKDYTIAHLLIETIGQFPQPVKFSALGERGGEMVSGVKIGDTVNVFFDITGRNYEGKVYNDLKLWKIESANQETTHTQIPDEMPVSNNDDDDLPF